jgi:hypothetical protein
MATPQMALDECDIPMNAVINVLADGTISGRVHRFIFDQGTIQFVSAYPKELTATFTPLGVFGDHLTGQVQIPGNGSTLQLSPNAQNVCVNYQVSGDSINTTPAQSVSVGCAPLTIVVDGNGNLSIEDSCIPNGGAITFVGAADVQPPGVTLTFTTNVPGKGSPLGKPITVKAGKSHSLHAINTDVTVTISTEEFPDGTGGTVKIGSGGGGPIK